MQELIMIMTQVTLGGQHRAYATVRAPCAGMRGSSWAPGVGGRASEGGRVQQWQLCAPGA